MASCKQCKSEFEIDEAFLKRISPSFGEMGVPRLCPDCRNIRRQIFRNDRTFYLRKCDLSGEQFVSMYPAESDFTVYKPKEWFGDKWNAMDFGMEFDFERGFFEQYKELQCKVPRLGIDIVNCENSEYCNYCGDDKNCYLDIAGEGNEDCYYNLFTKHSTNCVDCTFAYTSELCYECINVYDCYSCQHSMYLENCNDCMYCYDLIGCQDCLFSHGLRNKQYYIFNERKTKEEYEAYMDSLHLSSFDQREKLMEGWTKFKTEKAIFRAAYILNGENCSGNNIKNSKNTHDSYNVLNCEDCKYLYDVLDAKDCQDMNYSLYKPELSYELISTLSMTKSAFSIASHYNNEIYYCDLVNNSKNLFGCIGLNHAQYCILNKQYSREEYEDLAGRIVEHMKTTGEWGEFFPEELSPHKYDETVAQEYFPRSQNEFSGKQFKVIPQEKAFYEKMQLPIPRKSPDERHLDRIALRTPRHLWERQCSKCEKSLMSSYKAERPEKVYCDECYKAEIY